MIVLILCLAIVVVSLYFLIKFKLAWDDVVSQFKSGNVIVYGRKGKGKDLLFAGVIAKRKRKHYSNIYYNDKTIITPINALSAGNNTYENFISGNVNKFDLLLEENVDYYLSEAGLTLPCQYNNLLNKQYPSLPIYYALSRHLTNSNIHINTQSLSRPWDKLREQADCYIRCMGVIKFLPLYFFVKVRVYDEYEDAKANLSPLSHSLFDSRTGRALRDISLSSRGYIREYWLPIRRKVVKYDTRYFKSLLVN